MKFRYLFLITLLFLGASVIFFTTPPKLKVLVVLLKGDRNTVINNDVYNGVLLFKEEDGKDLQIIIREVKDEVEAKEVIDKLHPNFIIAAVHKPVFEKLLDFYQNEYEKFINIFPFYESQRVKNLSPSFNDLSSEVVKFLKKKSVLSVNIRYDDTHITKLMMEHVKRGIEDSGIEISKDSSFYLMIFNDVLHAEHEISHVVIMNKGIEGIIVSVYPFRFYDFYGKYIEDLYAVFPKYFFTDKGQSFVEKYKSIFRCFPNWPAVLAYDALSMISRYGKEVNKIVKYSGVAGEYNFSESDNLFIISKFKDIKVR